jgi:hypothetical protein
MAMAGAKKTRDALSRDNLSEAGPVAPIPASKSPDPKNDQGKRDEIGGPAGPEPTRYGDWERNGRCSDF